MKEGIVRTKVYVRQNYDQQFSFLIFANSIDDVYELNYVNVFPSLRTLLICFAIESSTNGKKIKSDNRVS